MLILRRLSGESIVLTIPPSDEPRRAIVRVGTRRGQRIAIGIDAPADILALRAELEHDGDGGGDDGGDGDPAPEPMGAAA
ncbi:MAG: carbon storage regulator [Planctomycetota bacterium]